MSHSMSQSHSRQAAYPVGHANDGTRPGGAHSSTSTKKPSVFDLHPPPWRPRLHPGSRQLGAPDVYIRSSIGSMAPEDELSEANVKNGISARPAVGNETFSAHDMIHDRLKGKAVVHQLGLLFDEVVQRREQLASLRCGPVSSQYRQPQRVTLNEVKLAAYVRELADASVPLRKLARSVPHGYRGERMLDMLWNGGNAGNAMAAAVKGQSAASVSAANNSAAASAASSGNPHGLPNSVAIDRAVWFVRVVGASEISSSRLRQGNSAAYTTEWTGVLMGWLRRQIVELNVAHHHPRSQMHHAHPILTGTLSHSNSIPSSPANVARSRQTPQTPQATPSQSQPQRSTDEEPPYALFLENDFRDRWLAKWRYSVSLLRALRYENLIDAQAAAHATLDMLRTANVVQLIVVLALLQEYLDVVADSVTLRHFALDVLSSKVEEYQSVTLLHANGSSHSGVNACKELELTLLYIVDASPDALVSPSCWSKLHVIIGKDQQCGASIGAEMRLAKAKGRNERLLSGFLTGDMEDDTTATTTSERLRDVQILDNFVVRQDIEATFDDLFRGRPASVSSEDKVRTILTWSTTRWRSGGFRPFAGATLIHKYVKLQPSRTTQRKETPSVLSVLQHLHHSGQQGERSEGRSASSLYRIDVDAVVMAWITDVDEAFKRASAMDGPTEVRWLSELEAISVPGLIVLVGELCRRDCFSFQKYLQRLTARGLTAMGGRPSNDGDRSDGNDVQDSLHTRLLRSISLFTSSAPLEHQRRTAIYGNRSKESWEEAMERRAVREVLAAFAFLTETSAANVRQTTTRTIHATDDVEEPLAHFWTSSRYVQSRVIHLHVLPTLRRQVERQSEVYASRDQFLSFVRLLSDAEQFAAVIEVSVLVAENDSREDMRHVAYLTITRNRLIWSSMDVPAMVGCDAIAEDQGTPKPHAAPSAVETKPEEKAAATMTKATESIRAFQAGRYDEADNILQVLRLSPDVALEVIINAVSAEKAAPIDAMVRWWLRVCPSSDKIDRSVALCTILNQVSSLTEAAHWTQITTRLACRDMISFGYIIDLFVIPALQEAPPLPASLPHSSIRIRLALGIVSALLATTSNSEEERAELQIACTRYLDDTASESATKFLQVICHIANAAHTFESHAEHDMATLAVKARQAICRNIVLQALVQSAPVDAITTVRNTTLTEALAHVVLNELLGSCWPWTSDQELADRSTAMMQSLDAFRWRQVLCEVSIAVGVLKRSHAAADMGAHGKLQSLARLVCSDIMGDDIDAATASFTLSMLTSNAMHGPSFATYLLEERVKRLGIQLEATFADEDRMRACLRSLLLVQRGFIDDGTAGSLPNTAVHALRLVTEWMESNVSATPVEAGSTTTTMAAPPTSGAATTSNGTRHWHREEDESVIVRLGVVCGLMQLDGLLATPSAKQLAPRLFCAILHIALGRSRRSDATEARLTPVLDVATYVLQQSPSDVQQTMQARALERLAALLQLQPCPLDGAGRRIASLIDHEQDSVRPLRLTANTTSFKAWQQQRTLLIEASSCSSAFLHGQFMPVAIKPWDLHLNVETLGIGSATTTAHNAADATSDGASAASTTELAALANNGPISLQHFGAYRTLDRIPAVVNCGRGGGSAQYPEHKGNGSVARPPASLHSEQSYGIHLAGESVYARDARRGLLAMHDLDDKRRIDMKHLVPALQQPTAEAQAKRGPSSTDTTPIDEWKQTSDTSQAGRGKPGRVGAKGKEAFATPTSTAAAAAAAARKRKTSSAALASSNEKKAPAGVARKRAKKDY